MLGQPAATLRGAPDVSASATSQLLAGEGFAVLDIAGGWAWGYCEHDHYVGYLPAEALADPVAATHVVTAPAAPVFATPDIKAPVVATLSLGARVAGTAADPFVATATGFVHQRHLGAIGRPLADPVAVAEMLLGAPYLWGGRGAGGIDCSGLVQLALGLCGMACPRDSDQQRDGMGMALPDDAPLRRGDLLFFPGHVGLMVDETRLLHANAWWMAVTIEPLADVVARLAPDHEQPITGRRRLSA